MRRVSHRVKRSRYFNPGPSRVRCSLALRPEIAALHAEFEIIEPSEIRKVDPAAHYGSPHLQPRHEERSLQLTELQPMIADLRHRSGRPHPTLPDEISGCSLRDDELASAIV